MPTQIELLKKYGLSIRGHLGQHLLIDPNIQRKIVDLLELCPQERVFEIGPGLGALTGEMLKRGAHVLAVEKDPELAKILEEELRPYGKNLEILREDILRLDLKKVFGGRRQKIKVISNLPYYITAPILFRLMPFHRRIPRAVFTMQKEVGRRLLASPGSKDYGRLTLAVRYYADVRHAFDIPRTCFTPMPEVDSSVIMLTFHPGRALPKKEEDLVFYLIAAAFRQRRKTLLHLLSGDPRIRKKRGELAELFMKMGWPPMARGEELLLKDFFTLAENLSPKKVKRIKRAEA